MLVCIVSKWWCFKLSMVRLVSKLAKRQIGRPVVCAGSYFANTSSDRHGDLMDIAATIAIMKPDLEYCRITFLAS